MRLDGVELRKVVLPLVAPFRTSYGTETYKEALLVRVLTPDGEGWGECVAESTPGFSAEYVDGCADVLRRFLVPAVAACSDLVASSVAAATWGVRGHPMAKAALEAAVLDAELRTAGRSLADELGAARTRVACGVSIGIMDSIPELLDAISGFLDAGYVRVKIKIAPGWDVDVVAAVRRRFGDDLALQVDANAAYRLADADHLSALDAYDLVLIEQPLGVDELVAHAELAKRLRTPICLDETITSAQVAGDAIGLGACAIVNIKPGRVGGYLEARRVHDVCGKHGVPVWCGGMLETGIGSAANLALAALPGFALPADLSPSDRYFRVDITAPLLLDDGHLVVPDGPGIGVVPLPDLLADATTHIELLRP